MSSSKKYYVETLFSDLPAGLPEDVLQTIVADFRRGDFKYRDMYIRAHTRLATSVALGYGHSYNRNDELIGVALLELCKYPQRIADGYLVDDRVTTYLLSRLHTVCLDFVRNDATLRVPHSSIVHCGAKKATRQELTEDSGIVSNGNQDMLNDILSCAVTERERLIIELSAKGCSNEDISRHLSSSVAYILRVKLLLQRRYEDRTRNDVQTFLPYPDFTQCAKCLDQKRLGKQRVECLQLLQNQYRGHPLYKMWRGYEYHLATYGIEICCEWLDRGFQDTCLEKIAQIRNTFVDNGPPFWLGDERLHRSHRSNLLRKNWEHYIQFGWKENPTIPYFWPVE